MIDENFIIRLREYLHRKTGKLYFKDIRTTSDNIIVTCPFHKNGQENKPSAGIRITNGTTCIGMFHCFTCGESMLLTDLVHNLLGPLYNEDEVESLFNLKILVAQGVLQSTSKQVMIKLPTRKSTCEKTLKIFRYYHTYLQSRNISKEVADIYDIGYDNINNQITFPIRDVERNCLAIGRRGITEKLYRYPPGFQKPLYGTYELPDKIRYLWICEGPFNLWSLRGWRKYGVALLGTGTEYQHNLLVNINCEGYVCSLDPDKAGRNGTIKLIKFLLEHKKTNIYVAEYPEGKDVNDLTQEEFKQVPIYSYKEWLKKYENV